MALPPAGTFEYVVKVPRENGLASFPWLLELGKEIEPRGDALFDDRAVGYSPFLWISDGGIVADSFGLRDEILVSRFTLRAVSRKNSSDREFSFHVERGLTLLFEPGDELRLTHTCMWGTGLTLLRNGKLVYAVGAINGQKLGKGILVQHPEDASERMLRFHKASYERNHKLPLFLPIEIHVESEMQSLYAGRAEIGGYGIWVEGGTDHAFPSGDSYLAIWAKGLCDESCAIRSTLMLKWQGSVNIGWE